MSPETNASKIAQAIMQYVHEKTNASGIRQGYYPIDRTEIELIVMERTGAKKEAIQAIINLLINGSSLTPRAIDGGMVSLK